MVAENSTLKRLSALDGVSDADRKQLGTPPIVRTFRTAELGTGGDVPILLAVPFANITILAAYLVSSKAIAADTNNPLLALATADLAAGALTYATSDLDTDNAPAAAQTKESFTVNTDGTEDVTAGEGLYLVVKDGSGAPAAITEDAMFTLVVEWGYTD